MPFSPIPEILEELKAGKPIVLVDDEDRENEGDIVYAAEKVTPEAINFLVKQARGVVCLAPASGQTPEARKATIAYVQALQAKLDHYFPQGIEQRYEGAWRDYVFHATPDRAIAYFRALIDAGIQYFIVETMDAMDHDTIRLLATDVIPAIRA